jgi:hypothetical protein
VEPSGAEINVPSELRFPTPRNSVKNHTQPELAIPEGDRGGKGPTRVVRQRRASGRFLAPNTVLFDCPQIKAHQFTLAAFLARRLVADALLARDPAAVIPFNLGSHRAASLSWADGDTTRTDANCGVGVVPPATVPIVVAVPPDLNIDTLGNLDALGLGRSDERGSR